MTRVIFYLERALLGMINLCFMLIPRPRPTREALGACKIISHRGEHDNRRVRENTLTAFSASAEAGCWGFEFDVRWTRDLQPVVVHDDNLQRVFGMDLAIAEVDLQELRERCPEVPTLAEVVGLFGGHRRLQADLKSDALRQCERRNQRLR